MTQKTSTQKTSIKTIPEKRTFSVEAVRADFPILSHPLSKNRKLVYLDNGASAQKPHCVIDAERELYEHYYANAYRGVYEFGAKVDERLENARLKIANRIHAESSEEVIFTSGTTMSLNMVARGWGSVCLNPGDQIVLNVMEHHANIVPWQEIAREKGAEIVYLPLTPDGRLDAEQFDQYITPKTKMVSVTAMSNVLGTINPVAQIAKRAHEVGALICVDAAQSIPHAEIDVIKDEIDFLAFSGHKVFGPTGIGVLYGKREHLERMQPLCFGGHMIDQVFDDHSTYAPIPAKFEAGTIPIAQAISLGAAMEYLDSFNLSEIEQHERALLESATKKLSEIPCMIIHGPATQYKGAIVSFTIEGAHPEDLAQLLNRKGVFVRHGHHCAMLLHKTLGVSATVRASFSLYNTEEEVDTLVDALQFARERLRLV